MVKMFGIGMGEFILILIVGLIIFGPKNLPEVGKALGKGLKEFRKAQAALSATLEEAAAEPVKKAEVKPQPVENKITAVENKPLEEKISLEKKSEVESARISVEDVINSANQNSITNETQKAN